MPLWAAGFSFGSWVALEVGADDDRACRALIAIAPPVRRHVGQSTRSRHAREHEAEVLRPRRGGRSDPARRRCATFYGRLQEPKELVVDRRANHLFEGRRRRSAKRSRNCWRTFDRSRPAMKDAVIVSAVRTAGRQGAERRAARHRPDEMARGRHRAKRSAARRRSIPRTIDDVILGCAMPEAEQGLNVARIASLRAGVPVTRVGGDGQSLLLVRASRRSPRRPSGSWSASPAPSSPAAPNR